jgi:hypothetical protein
MRFSRSLIPIFLAFATLAPPTIASAQVSVGLNITLAPPPLPIYAQPPLPAPGYLWTPGYWAYGPAGYYWVPGTWVQPPAVGLLWTPGYWGWAGGFYGWHVGYWGPHVGFYGGVNYGFGYTGVGFVGGVWDHGVFRFNPAGHLPPRGVLVSFNGGVGGIRAQPTQRELAFANERHFGPTGEQAQHEHAAAGNHALLASVNHNHPPIGATARPGEFKGPGVVAARQGAPGGPNRAEARPQGGPGHPAEQRGRPEERREHPEERGEHQ